MRFHYDKKEDALYIRFNENPYQKSEEVASGIIFDYDKQGKIIGIEILDASRKFPHQFKMQLLKKRLPLSKYLYNFLKELFPCPPPEAAGRKPLGSREKKKSVSPPIF